jgi:uncharacterized protein (DUF2345 family)
MEARHILLYLQLNGLPLVVAEDAILVKAAERSLRVLAALDVELAKEEKSLASPANLNAVKYNI